MLKLAHTWFSGRDMGGCNVLVRGPYKDTKGGHTQQIKGLKKAKAKKDSLKKISELFPVQKYAGIKGHMLILTDLDGSKEVVELVGCHVTVVFGGEQA